MRSKESLIRPGGSGSITDEELAKQAAKDLDNREQELRVLDSDSRKLVHKLNEAMG